MTFLPILDRELRARARSRGTYWTRFALALVGVLICLPQLMSSGPFSSLTTVGPFVLNGLVGAAFVLSCAACLLTADVISSERREGTLGLLLLTRVRTFDVLVGKLGSAGLTSLCALVAFLPMLMIPVLAGGVTGGETLRKGLALPNTLFLALAAGLWASARGQEWVKTGRNALLVMAAVLAGPYVARLVCGPLLTSLQVPNAPLDLLSPVATLLAAGDGPYKAAAADYWISLGLVQAAGWALLVHAGRRLRHGWQDDTQDRAVEAASPAPAEYEAEAARPATRPLGDEENPIAWLLRRQRGTLAILWAAALVGFAYNGLFLGAFRFWGVGFYSGVVMPLSLGQAALESALFAWAASRFLVEARRTGELELLLTTPIGARQVVSMQWVALKRMLRWPMVIMLTPILLRPALWLMQRRAGMVAGNYWLSFELVASPMLSAVNIVLGIGALCWMGMWFGLKAGAQGRAIVWTIGLVKGLPYLSFMVWWFLLGPLMRIVGSGIGLPVWIISWLGPNIITLLFYLWLIHLAQRALLRERGLMEPMALDLGASLVSQARAVVAALGKARHWTPS